MVDIFTIKDINNKNYIKEINYKNKKIKKLKEIS